MAKKDVKNSSFIAILTKFILTFSQGNCKLYIKITFVNGSGGDMTIDMEKDITNAEWEVMRVVWAQKEVPSQVIIDVLKEKRGWKEPTIKTLIGRLVKKNALQTKKEGRKFLYSTDIEEDALVNETLAQFFHNICSRDIGKTIGVLIDQAMLSHEDLTLLSNKIKHKEQEAFDTVPCNCVRGQCHCQHHS